MLFRELLDLQGLSTAHMFLVVPQLGSPFFLPWPGCKDLAVSVISGIVSNN